MSLGESADAVSIFDLEKGDRWPGRVTSGVEEFAVPPMRRSLVEKSSYKFLVAQQLEQVFLLRSLCGTLGVN